MLYLSKNTNKIYSEKFDSPFRPSNLPTLMACSGYAILKNDDPVHEIAIEGSNAHDLVLQAFKEGLKKKKKIYPAKDNKTIAFLDCYDLTKSYLDRLYGLYLKNEWLYFGLECFFSSNFYNYLIGGTTDFFFVHKNKKKVIISDLKTGFKPTPSVSFYQLNFYALAVGTAIQAELDTEFELELHTRFEVKTKKVTFKDLLLYKNRVLSKINNLSFNVGEHCSKCYRFKHCEKAQTTTEKHIKSMDKNPEALKHLKNHKIIKKYLDEAHSLVVEKHKNGIETEGFEVYKTPGKRFWKNTAKEELLKKKGMTDIKLISVRDALKKGIDVQEGIHYTLNPEFKVKPTKE